MRASSDAAERLGDTAVEQRALGDAEAHRATDQRFRPRRRQRVQVVAVLAADFDQVLEARVGEKRDARAFLFEQRIGRDGRAVGDRPRRGAREHLMQSADDGVGGIGRRREHFVHADFAADDRDEVGKRAAGVDSDQYRPLHERSQQNFEVQRILRGFKCGNAVVKREGSVDQRARIDLAASRARRAPAETGRIAIRRR